MRLIFSCAAVLLLFLTGCGGEKKAASGDTDPEVAKEPSAEVTPAEKDDLEKEKAAEPKSLFRPRPLRDDPQSLAKLQELGAELQFNKFGLVHSAEFTSGDIKEVLVGMKGLKECRVLRLANLKLTDTQLVAISQMPLAKHLEELEVSGKKITDASIATLSSFPKLVQLKMSGTAVSKIGGLSKLTSLQKLDLSWTDVTGDQLPLLSSLASLSHLDIAWTDIDAKSLESLKKMANLKSIAIEGSGVMDVEPEKLAATFKGIRLQGLPVKELPEKKAEPKPDPAKPAQPMAPPQAFAVGDAAPEITGADIDGKPFKLSDYRGKVVLLDFWGHWCVHCRRLYPHAGKLIKQYKDAPFVMLGVNSDEDRELLQQIVKTEELAWRSWFDGGPDGPIATAWGIRGWPTLYLIDHTGVIRHIGLRGAALDQALAKLVNEAKVKPKKKAEIDDSL